MKKAGWLGIVIVGVFVACGPGGDTGGEIGNLDVTGPERPDGASSDAGGGTDSGQETVMDPGGLTDSGQEAVVPGECSLEINPQCEPKDCKLPDGTAGKCAKDANGDCGCTAEVPPQDPCGPELNPQCEPRKCPIAPNVDGLCALDLTTGQCTCGGGGVTDPCSQDLNPECRPDACELLDGTTGKCAFNYRQFCDCVPTEPGVDPCDENTLNPNCVPRECDDGIADTLNDRCRFVVDPDGVAKCGCVGDVFPEDSCNPVFNPECKPAICKMENGGEGKCQKDEDGTCSCQPEVVPVDPCGKDLNPTCEPKECWLPDGSVGTCRKDAAGGCGCAPFVPPQDPCGKELNPECKMVGCDDGNPATVKDVCRWVADPVGFEYCKCQGEYVPYDPCDLTLNPECKPVDCKMASGVAGKCQKDEKVGCSCQPEVVPVDPCGKDLNPTCEPKECWLPDGSVGTCRKDAAGGCGCAPFVPPQDPCGKELNPECKMVGCDDGNPATVKDVCRWVADPAGFEYCKCQGEYVPYDPCDLTLNPECKPADCKLVTGAVGKCQKDEKVGCSCQPEVVPVDPCGKDLNPTCEPKECWLPDGSVGTCRKDAAGGCGCAPFVPPQDPCGKELNPECKMVGCDDGNPATVKDVCRWVVDPVGFEYCKCQGEYVPYYPCDLTLNPECKPADCKMASGVTGKCQKDEKLGCSCQPEVTPTDPCSLELNPQCKPIKCAIAPNVDGLCALDPITGACKCGGGVIPDDPCGPILNPECKPAQCDDGNPLTQKDQCQWVKDPVGITYCGCLGQFIVNDPCSLLINPECKPVDCKTVTGAPGKCGPDILFGCSCKPVEPEDPCGPALNPKCEPLACDDGDPGTENDSCRFVVSPIGLQTCACQGQPVVFDPCDLFFNPACKPASCVNQKGVKGQCGWTANGTCDCVASTTQCAKDSDCLVLDWLVDCVGHWDCLEGQCREVCGKPCGDGVCQPGQGEGPQTCPPDCMQCKDNADCTKTDFCLKANGDCGGTGVCAARPTLCPLVFNPVCGCDGNTYSNWCDAHAAGVNVWYDGPCMD